MQISLLDVIGPVMIGPSSSHTAGAAKLSKVARTIVGKPFTRVSFGLSGSFASTYKGHFTDYALVAGAIGLSEDDERLSKSFMLAQEQNISYDFYSIELESSYENMVRMTFYFADDTSTSIEGASLGGGRILITNIFGNPCEFTASCPTIILQHRDVNGVISDVTTILANHKINIGIMRLNRSTKGDVAYCVIECDDDISDKVKKSLEEVPNIISAIVVNL